jgi:hypothetical protein
MIRVYLHKEVLVGLLLIRFVRYGHTDRELIELKCQEERSFYSTQYPSISGLFRVRVGLELGLKVGVRVRVR